MDELQRTLWHLTLHSLSLAPSPLLNACVLSCIRTTTIAASCTTLSSFFCLYTYFLFSLYIITITSSCLVAVEVDLLALKRSLHHWRKAINPTKIFLNISLLETQVIVLCICLVICLLWLRLYCFISSSTRHRQHVLCTISIEILRWC